jgi:hypothetical protein
MTALSIASVLSSLRIIALLVARLCPKSQAIAIRLCRLLCGSAPRFRRSVPERRGCAPKTGRSPKLQNLNFPKAKGFPYLRLHSRTSEPVSARGSKSFLNSFYERQEPRSTKTHKIPPKPAASFMSDSCEFADRSLAFLFSAAC